MTRPTRTEALKGRHNPFPQVVRVVDNAYRPGNTVASQPIPCLTQFTSGGSVEVQQPRRNRDFSRLADVAASHAALEDRDAHEFSKRPLLSERPVTAEAVNMTGKEFMNAVANSRRDILQVFLDILARTGSQYCIIGGLAVNAYAEPVVSLDLDIVVASEDVTKIIPAAQSRGFKVEQLEHGIRLSNSDSNFRIQLQTDPRYQEFIPRSSERETLGYRMRVAEAADVLQGKVWAYRDETRPRSKRQKDLADILRLVEANPALGKLLPADIRRKLE